MLSSPQSSLSSFRDYCQRSTQRQLRTLDEHSQIALGFRNFQMSKIFHRIESKITQHNYWTLFNAFHRLKRKQTVSSTKLLKKIKLNHLLKHLKNKQTNTLSKIATLNCWLQGVALITQRQQNSVYTINQFNLQKGHLNLSLAYERLLIKAFKKQPRYSEQKVKRICRLSKALLCIVFRNQMKANVRNKLEVIIQASLLDRNQKENPLVFFKQQKDRKVFIHKNDNKIKILKHFTGLFTMLVEKTKAKMNIFFRIFKKTYRTKSSKKSRESTCDSLDIMSNVVKHMIFLTNKFTTKTKNQLKLTTNEIKARNLKKILLKLRVKQRQSINDCIFHWRKVVREENMEIEREIERLETIKKEYLQDF